MTFDRATQALPLASVVITTRGRSADTLRAAASSFAQDLPSLEVHVFDDASSDGTVDIMRRAFPQAHVHALARRVGLIENRNRGFREARGKYVFSLDDDAYFSQSDIVSRTVAMLEADPTIGAVAIPYIEPFERRSRSSLAQPLEARPGSEIRSYVACACAVRRDLALDLGGYREGFVRQHEEAEFCLRIWASGARIVYGDSAPVVHTVSPRREHARIIYYGVRNQILAEVLHAPLADVPGRLVRIMAGALAYKFSLATALIKLKAIAAGFIEGAKLWPERRAVPPSIYRAFRDRPAHGPEHWEGAVPLPCHRRASAA